MSELRPSVADGAGSKPSPGAPGESDAETAGARTKASSATSATPAVGHPGGWAAVAKSASAIPESTGPASGPSSGGAQQPTPKVTGNTAGAGAGWASVAAKSPSGAAAAPAAAESPARPANGAGGATPQNQSEAQARERTPPTAASPAGVGGLKKAWAAIAAAKPAGVVSGKSWAMAAAGKTSGVASSAGQQLIRRLQRARRRQAVRNRLWVSPPPRLPGVRIGVCAICCRQANLTAVSAGVAICTGRALDGTCSSTIIARNTTQQAVADECVEFFESWRGVGG